MGPKKKTREQQPAGSITTSRQVLWCADVISVVAEFLPPTDQYQKPLMLVSKLWLEGVAQQHGMKVLGNDVHWPFAALRHRGSQKLIWSSTPPLSTADLEDLVENVPSSQVSSLALFDVSPEVDLACLSRMENLTALRVWTLAKEFPHGLGVLTSLITLSVQGDAHSADCETVSALRSLEHLECLRLHSSAPLTVEALNHLTKLKVLTSLSLDADGGCGDEHMNIVGQMTQLTELSLRLGIGFGDDGMASLSKLVNLTSLKLWNVNSISGKGLRLLGKLKKLTHFDVNCQSWHTISNEDLAFFPELQELQRFELDLDDSFILTDNGLEHITHAHSLRTLNFRRWKSNVTDAGAKHLERLQQLRSLELPKLPSRNASLASLAPFVYLEYLKVSSPVSMSEFCVLTTFKKLKTLRVRFIEDAKSSSKLDGSDDNVSCLEDLHVSNANDLVLHRISMIHSLTVLHVEDSASVTDDGVQYLSSLVNLEKLSMSKLAITACGFSGFGNKLRKLRELTLQTCNNLVDHGMHHICELITLRSLVVNNCVKLSESAFSRIAKMRHVKLLLIVECAGNSGFVGIAHMRSLEALWLMDCDITSEFLHSLRSNESLQYLYVVFTKLWNKKLRFTAEDMEDLIEHKEGIQFGSVSGSWREALALNA